MPRRVRGDKSFARLLKQLPASVKQEIVVEHNVTGREVLAEQQARVPVLKGRLKAGLSMKVLPASLRLQVGLIGKPINKKLHYGRIVQFGRKAQIVIATRKGVLAATRPLGGRVNAYKNLALKHGVRGAYRMRIRAMAGRNFLYPRTQAQLAEPYKAIWERALNKAASGVGDE